jgi:tRNA pseudouridine55 synthase
VTSAAPATLGTRVDRRTGAVLALNKPAGITSFDAVREVRRVFHERRVGHAGTLDPSADGLLPVCIGRATRLVDYFHAQPKTYHCVVRLGERSDTFDLEGVITPGSDASGVRADDVRAALQRFVGDITQVPPMHSAARHEGRHLYELARAGQHVERHPRPARIDAIELVDFRPGRVAEAELRVTSGKGAYMRVLAADVGDALGTGGVLGWLTRTAYGRLKLDDAVPVETLHLLDDPWAVTLPLDVAAAHLPRIDVAPSHVQQLRHGQPVWLPRTLHPPEAGECRVHELGGQLVAIADVQGGLLRPLKVIAA